MRPTDGDNNSAKQNLSISNDESHAFYHHFVLLFLMLHRTQSEQWNCMWFSPDIDFLPQRMAEGIADYFVFVCGSRCNCRLLLHHTHSNALHNLKVTLSV